MTINTHDVRREANKNIDAILEALNVFYTERGNLLKSTCPCEQHGGDRNNQGAFCWNLEINRWVCWTHHCEQDFGSDIFGLVRSILDVTFMESVDFILKCLNSENTQVPRHHRKQQCVKKSYNRPLGDHLIKFLRPEDPPKYLVSRGFNGSILTRFEVGFWKRIGSYMHERVVFPIRDHNHDLVGFSGRTIHPETEWDRRRIDAKWLHGKYYDRYSKEELKTGLVLYNLCNAKNYFLENIKSVFLVEGPLDGLKLEEAGIRNWVACLGCSFGSEHRNLLINYGVSRIILALDPDKAGVLAAQRIFKNHARFFNIVSLELDTDPGDMSVTQIRDKFLCLN